MKLKTKLFLSYFVLIFLSGIALFWLIVEIRQLTTSLRTHVSQDVRSIIEISQQLQILEDLNTAYILVFIPGKTIRKKSSKLETALNTFEKNWVRLRKTMQTVFPRSLFDRILNRIYVFVYSRFDLGNGWEQFPHPYSYGYEAEDAMKLGTNVLIYAVTH